MKTRPRVATIRVSFFIYFHFIVFQLIRPVSTERFITVLLKITTVKVSRVRDFRKLSYLMRNTFPKTFLWNRSVFILLNSNQ
jgi:hypothetical protein